MQLSHAEELFAKRWLETFPHGPRAVREFRFHKVRRWRFDFAWPEMKVALEIQGVGSRGRAGRHQRVPGMRNDCEKYSVATLEGWAVLLVLATDARKNVDEWVERVEELLNQRAV